MTRDVAALPGVTGSLLYRLSLAYHSLSSCREYFLMYRVPVWLLTASVKYLSVRIPYRSCPEHEGSFSCHPFPAPSHKATMLST